MTPAPFDDPRLDAAWRAYAGEHHRRQPPPGLEARTLARIAAVASSRGGRANRATGKPAAVVMAVAAALVIAVLTWPRSQPAGEPGILESRAVRITGLPPIVEPDRPARMASAPQRNDVANAPDPYVPHAELPAVLMMFDAAPLQEREPLQMVRLRLPREALRALGLVLLEPDAGGVVDVDVLVGEDGLPRDIRQVRLGQEQR
ncbi:MAG: hypothetical protein AB7P34_20155 [Vicinamibacterales bacterium]